MANLYYTFDGSYSVGDLNTLSISPDNVYITIEESVADDPVYMANILGDSVENSGVDDVFSIKFPDGWSYTFDKQIVTGLQGYEFTIYDTATPGALGRKSCR